MNDNHELIRRGLDLLRLGLRPFVQGEMSKVYGDSWEEEGRNALGTPSYAKLNWDTHALLKLIDRRWNDVFWKKLEKRNRAWVHEALALRNDFAHQNSSFSDNDALRGLDTIEHLLVAVSAPESRDVALLKRAIGDRSQTSRAEAGISAATSRLAAQHSLSGFDGRYLPIELVPSDPIIFRQQLLRSRVAEIAITYADGRVKTKIWRAQKFTESSNVIGNLRSRPEFRAGQWQANGIVKVTVRVIDNP